MPKVFEKDCKIKVIEYGAATMPSVCMRSLSAKILSRFKRFLHL
jgi:uncharacterized protein YuzB (UPF0349 family)